jgi:hypothetical protein
MYLVFKSVGGTRAFRLKGQARQLMIIVSVYDYKSVIHILI